MPQLKKKICDHAIGQPSYKPLYFRSQEAQQGVQYSLVSLSTVHHPKPREHNIGLAQQVRQFNVEYLTYYLLEFWHSHQTYILYLKMHFTLINQVEYLLIFFSKNSEFYLSELITVESDYLLWQSSVCEMVNFFKMAKLWCFFSFLIAKFLKKILRTLFPVLILKNKFCFWF